MIIVYEAPMGLGMLYTYIDEGRRVVVSPVDGKEYRYYTADEFTQETER